MTQVWFVTGVSSRLGLEIALKMLASGFTVVGTVRSRGRAAKQVQQIERQGGKCLELDVTNSRACFDVFQQAEKLHGMIDVLVNNAGYSLLGAVEDFTDEEVQAQMDVTFYGSLRLIQAALPGLRRRKTGTIVNITSTAAINGLLSCGLYAASKFALEGLSESLAREVEEHNIQVLVVEPGALRTISPRDASKSAARIIEAFSGTGMARPLKGKVLRLLLGSDCVGRMEAKIKSLSRIWRVRERWRSAWITTDAD